MYMKFLPIGMVVLSSLCYHISQKSTPTGLSPSVALIVTYVIAAIVSVMSYFIFVPKSNVGTLMTEMGSANWASYLLGFAVVGLLFFKESISLTSIIGVGVCIVGLILVSK